MKLSFFGSLSKRVGKRNRKSKALACLLVFSLLIMLFAGELPRSIVFNAPLWFLTYVLPGFALFRCCKPGQVRLIEAIPVSIVISIVLTILCYLSGSIFSISAVCFLYSMIVSSIFFLLVRHIRHADAFDISCDTGDMLALLLCFVISVLMVSPAMICEGLRCRPDNQLMSGVTFSIMRGDFPPEMPCLAGYPLTYYWCYNVPIALFSSVSGFHPTTSIYIISFTGFFAALCMLYALSRSVGSTRSEGIVAVMLLFLGLGTLSGLRLAGELVAGDVSLADLAGVNETLRNLGCGSYASMLVNYLSAHSMSLCVPSAISALYAVNESYKGVKGALVVLFFSVLAANMLHPPIGIYLDFALAGIVMFRSFSSDCGVSLKIVGVATLVVLILSPYAILITKGSGAASTVYDSLFRGIPRGKRMLEKFFREYAPVIGPLSVLAIFFCRRKMGATVLIPFVVLFTVYFVFNTPGGSWKCAFFILIPASIMSSWVVCAGASLLSSNKCVKAIIVSGFLLLLAPKTILFLYGYSRHPLAESTRRCEPVYSWIRCHTSQDSVFMFQERYFHEFLGRTGRSAFFFDKCVRQYGYDLSVVEERKSLVGNMLLGHDIINNLVAAQKSIRRPLYVVYAPGQVKRQVVQLFQQNRDCFVVHEVVCGAESGFVIECVNRTE